MASHPGFSAVANKISAKEGVSQKAAGAILASSTRKASPAAKKKNPRLKNVKPAKPKFQSDEIADRMLGEK